MTTEPESVARTPLFIGGEKRWTASTSPIVDPARPRVIVGEASEATPADVEDAVSAARAAFPSWAALDPLERAELLREAVYRSDDDWNEDARVLARENGKILAECLRDTAMLARRTARVTELAAEVNAGRILPREGSIVTETEVGYQPLGVITIIVPFNWPVGILSSALPYALLAGNTVIIKPPRTAPLATTRVAVRFAEALPPGVVNVITGRDEDMAGLTANPRVQKVCFTGSVAGGRRIMELASQSLTRVTLELGGNDPALILEDAVLDTEHLDRLFAGIFASTGQICMNAKRLYVHRSRMAEVVSGLSERLSGVRLGDALDAETTMGPLHAAAQKTFVETLLDEARQAGADVRSFGALPEDPQLAEGHFVRPAIIVDADPALRVVTEEQFGPIAPIVLFDAEEEAITLANDSWAGLSASVWTADLERARRIAQQLVCGYVWVNDHGAPRLDLRAPFGGMKQSGMGREQGIEGIRAFQDTRAFAILREEETAA